MLGGCEGASIEGMSQGEHPPSPIQEDLGRLCLRGGLDAQFLQAILAHTRIHSTLDRYSHGGLGELKRRFAALDLADEATTVDGRHHDEARVLLEKLRGVGPKGKERPWTQLIDGMQGLLELIDD